MLAEELRRGLLGVADACLLSGERHPNILVHPSNKWGNAYLGVTYRASCSHQELQGSCRRKQAGLGGVALSSVTAGFQLQGLEWVGHRGQ